jgi:hypothetical protein
MSLFSTPAKDTEPPSTGETIPDSVPLDPDSVKAVALAQLSLDDVLERQSTTLAQAVARYSLKTGRPPPQNYDKWFAFAKVRRPVPSFSHSHTYWLTSEERMLDRRLRPDTTRL